MKIGGEPSERITERIMRHQQAVDVTHVGSQCELSLKIPGESNNLKQMDLIQGWQVRSSTLFEKVSRCGLVST